MEWLREKVKLLTAMEVYMKGRWKQDTDRVKAFWLLVQDVKKKFLKVIFVKMSSKGRVNWYSETETFIEGNLVMEFWMVQVKYSQNSIRLLVKWRKELLKEKGALSMHLEIYIRASLYLIKSTDMGNIPSTVEMFIKANGRMISEREKESWFSKMEPLHRE